MLWTSGWRIAGMRPSHAVLDRLCKISPRQKTWHMHLDQSRLRFRGRQLSQQYNRKSIKISMSKFLQDMEPIAVPNMSKTTWMLHGKQMYTPNFVEYRSASKVAIAKKSVAVVLPAESYRASQPPTTVVISWASTS